MLLERGEPGEVYNLCSGGHGRSSRCSTSTWEQSHTKGIAVEIDRERLRPSDVMLLQGDSSKIRRCLGWEAEIPFEHTLKDLHVLAALGCHGGSTRDRFQIRGWSGTLIPKHYMIVEDPNLNGARCPTPSCATPGRASGRLTSHSRANGLVPASSKGCHGT